MSLEIQRAAPLAVQVEHVVRRDVVFAVVRVVGEEGQGVCKPDLKIVAVPSVQGGRQSKKVGLPGAHALLELCVSWIRPAVNGGVEIVTGDWVVKEVRI